MVLLRVLRAARWLCKVLYRVIKLFHEGEPYNSENHRGGLFELQFAIANQALMGASGKVH